MGVHPGFKCLPADYNAALSGGNKYEEGQGFKTNHLRCRVPSAVNCSHFASYIVKASSECVFSEKNCISLKMRGRIRGRTCLHMHYRQLNAHG